MYIQKSKWVVIALTLYICVPSWSQYNVTTIQAVEDKYNDLGNIFQVVINPMVEDSLGFIWVGTKKGLCRYSGSTIKCLKQVENDKKSIRSNNIENLFLDSDHNIWVALLGKGIDVFNIRGEKIKEFKYNSNNRNGLLANRVWGIFEDNDGFIWISYFSGGLTRYDKQKYKFDHFSIDSEEFLKTERPKTIVKVLPHESEAHTFWLSTTRGLVKFNTRTQEYKHFMFTSTIQRGLTESTYNDDVLKSVWNRDMIRDSSGILWLSNFGGIVRFDPEDYSYQVLFYNDGNFTKDGVGLFELNDREILASVNSGLVLINKKTLQVTTLKNEEEFGEKYHIASRFFESKAGCLYLISSVKSNIGIRKICEESSAIRKYNTGVFLESILATDNYYHYLYEGGVIASRNIKSNELSKQSLKNPQIRNIKYMYDLGDDTLLVATVNELFKYHPSGFLKLIDPLVIDNAYRFESVLRDSDGDIWSGRQRDGIYALDISEGEVIHYNQESQPRLVYQDYIRSMMEDSEGEIWICTENGWTIFNKKSKSTKNYLSDDIASKFGVDIKSIVDVVEAPNGKFYIADSAYGIIVWDKKTASVIKSIKKSDGLKSGAIYDLNLDGNLIWICEENALSVIDTKTDSVRSFGKAFGIDNSPYFSSSDQYGAVYAAHEDGYYVIDRDRLLATVDKIPSPIITEFKIFESNADSLLFSEENVTLTHKENFFTFNFGSINYFNPSEEKYQYQLVGVDDNWIDSKGQKSKGYTDIRPGKYTFKLRVKTTADWSVPIHKNIRIKPAWYQTLWFYLLLSAVLLGIAYLILNNYLKVKKKESDYEKRFAQLETMILKSQMNPHFIFNSLNSIRYMFMVDEKEKGLKYITKFAKLLRTTLHHGEQALIRLEEEIELTELFVQLEQLRFDDEFSFSSDFSFDHEWKDLRIPPFVIQPIVENAFWHGLSQSEKKEKNINITIKKEDEAWWIMVEDNGIGFTNTKPKEDAEVNKKKSYGLNIIRERFELINKTEDLNYHLFISNRKEDSGTIVSIQITSN